MPPSHPPPSFSYIAGRAATLEAYRAVLSRLRSAGLSVGEDPLKVRRFSLLQQQKDLAAAPPPGMEPHAIFRGQAFLTVGMMLAQGVELVSSHGCGSALAHFRRDMEEWRKLREQGGRQKMALKLSESR
jgi:ERCC4-related helicase